MSIAGSSTGLTPAITALRLYTGEEQSLSASYSSMGSSLSGRASLAAQSSLRSSSSGPASVAAQKPRLIALGANGQAVAAASAVPVERYAYVGPPPSELNPSSPRDPACGPLNSPVPFSPTSHSSIGSSLSGRASSAAQFSLTAIGEEDLLVATASLAPAYSGVRDPRIPKTPPSTPARPLSGRVTPFKLGQLAFDAMALANQLPKIYQAESTSKCASAVPKAKPPATGGLANGARSVPGKRDFVNFCDFSLGDTNKEAYDSSSMVEIPPKARSLLNGDSKVEEPGKKQRCDESTSNPLVHLTSTGFVRIFPLNKLVAAKAAAAAVEEGEKE